MRFDKFTTKFQQALSDAQSIAVGGDQQFIEPSHLLLALLNLTDKNAQKRGDQFIASEMFLLALADDKGESGRLLKEHGLQKKALEAAIEAVRGVSSVGGSGVWRPARRNFHRRPAFRRLEPAGRSSISWMPEPGSTSGPSDWATRSAT